MYLMRQRAPAMPFVNADGVGRILPMTATTSPVPITFYHWGGASCSFATHASQRSVSAIDCD